MRGKNKIQVNLVLLWRRNAMEGKSPAPQPTLSWLVIQVFAPCIDHQKSWYAVTKESCGIIPRFFSQNIFFSRFPDEIFSVSKQDLSVMSKKWREEAVRQVGPRERGDSSKTTKQSVYCEFIWTFCRPFATARNFRKTRLIWIFCQDKELCEWCLCWFSNWRQKQWKADHTKFECKNWKSWARTRKVEMYKKFLSWTNAVTSLPVNNRDAWVHRTPVFQCEFVSPGVYKGIFTRNLLDWPELWNATFRYP